jgi:hypothetical protein
MSADGAEDPSFRSIPLLALLCTTSTDGSILVFRLTGQFMISDAFFAFSAMKVRFGQVTGRAFGQCLAVAASQRGWGP